MQNQERWLAWTSATRNREESSASKNALMSWKVGENQFAGLGGMKWIRVVPIAHPFLCLEYETREPESESEDQTAASEQNAADAFVVQMECVEE